MREISQNVQDRLSNKAHIEERMQSINGILKQSIFSKMTHERNKREQRVKFEPIDEQEQEE